MNLDVFRLNFFDENSIDCAHIAIHDPSQRTENEMVTMTSLDPTPRRSYP